MILLATVLSSCAPVLREEIMRTASRDVVLSDMRSNPDAFKGQLFVLGGSIVSTRVTEKGSLIEAIYVPVDSRGYLESVRPSDGRFLALYPKEKGLLDPFIYRRAREVTLAGEFLEIQKGKIDEMDYTFPLFEIKEIYLWEEMRVYYPYHYPYYPYRYYPYWWDEPWPWWRHYHPYWW